MKEGDTVIIATPEHVRYYPAGGTLRGMVGVVGKTEELPNKPGAPRIEMAEVTIGKHRPVKVWVETDHLICDPGVSFIREEN